MKIKDLKPSFLLSEEYQINIFQYINERILKLEILAK